MSILVTDRSEWVAVFAKRYLVLFYLFLLCSLLTLTLPQDLFSKSWVTIPDTWVTWFLCSTGWFPPPLLLNVPSFLSFCGSALSSMTRFLGSTVTVVLRFLTRSHVSLALCWHSLALSCFLLRPSLLNVFVAKWVWWFQRALAVQPFPLGSMPTYTTVSGNNHMHA